MGAEEEKLGLSSDLGKVTTRIIEGRGNSEQSETSSEREQREGWLKWESLSRKLGVRYSECKLSGFVFSDDQKIQKKQRDAINALKAFTDDLVANIASGRGLVLFGPAGTGKDHCLAAMMRKACWHNLDVGWKNGMDLFADRRDGIDRGIPERELIRDLVSPDILSISDPIPPWGELTAGQGEFLFRIVDARYRQRKPIWVTANFSEGTEAEKRIGKQVVDRLRDGSLALHFDWPSYRKRSNG